MLGPPDEEFFVFIIIMPAKFEYEKAVADVEEDESPYYQDEGDR